MMRYGLEAKAAVRSNAPPTAAAPVNVGSRSWHVGAIEGNCLIVDAASPRRELRVWVARLVTVAFRPEAVEIDRAQRFPETMRLDPWFERC